MGGNTGLREKKMARTRGSQDVWSRNRNHPAYKLMRWFGTPMDGTRAWHRLRFDGSCRNNGAADATGGYGWTLHDPAGRLEASGHGSVGGERVTNNVAEWSGLAAGIRAAQGRLGTAAGVRIEGDSNLVVKCLSGAWKCRDRRMAEWRDACLDALSAVGLPWVSLWIPREENAECDELSVRHEMPDNLFPPADLAVDQQ
jgi:ribonuclease HI